MKRNTFPGFATNVRFDHVKIRTEKRLLNKRIRDGKLENTNSDITNQPLREGKGYVFNSWGAVKGAWVII